LSEGATERYERALVWFRRDLRDFDHAALSRALRCTRSVYCAFVLDRDILDALPDRRDRRVEFIVESLRELDAALRAAGGGLIVRHARAQDAIPELATKLRVGAVFANRDYEPGARARDDAVAKLLASKGIGFHTCKDQVIFERDEVLTRQRTPFTVFTPYRKAWLEALSPSDVAPHDVKKYAAQLARPPAALGAPVPSLAEIGFERTDLAALDVRSGMSGGAERLADFRDRIDRYRNARDYPAQDGSSHLSMALPARRASCVPRSAR
jgi:deoxyribodipyrimidine photo-lyase